MPDKLNPVLEAIRLRLDPSASPYNRASGRAQPFDDFRGRGDRLFLTGPDGRRYCLLIEPVGREHLECDTTGELTHHVADADGHGATFDLGHVEKPRSFPDCLEDQYQQLLHTWFDGLRFAEGADSAVEVAWQDHIGRPR